MANNPQHDDKRHSGDTSDQSRTKQPAQDKGKDGSASRTPGDHRRGTDPADGMKRPTDKRDDAKR